jgi:hypothetical protein|tara:strand:+ start:1199 stop:1429 length:231 start_codon:yes stop_codon:yes gene_type:complete
LKPVFVISDTIIETGFTTEPSLFIVATTWGTAPMDENGGLNSILLVINIELPRAVSSPDPSRTSPPSTQEPGSHAM